MAAATLSSQLAPAIVDFATLEQRFGPMLALVKELIGVVPNCDPVLEIWPPAFRTYNLLVPNLLNLPVSLWGSGDTKALTGLAMYTSSRTASCAYCSAHTCSYAQRRGLPARSLHDSQDEREQAVIALAQSMAELPPQYARAHYARLAKRVKSGDIEWIALSVGLMGFLNKFMDAMGIPLEPSALAEVAPLLEPAGWRAGQHAMPDQPLERARAPVIDSLGTYVRVVRHAPGALTLERRWTRGVPKHAPGAMQMLQNRTGYAFAFLAHVKKPRVVRAITTVLLDNLSADESVLGIPEKCLLLAVYAEVVKSEWLAAAAVEIASKLAPQLMQEHFLSVVELAALPVPGDADECRAAIEQLAGLSRVSQESACALLLARACAPSPAQVGQGVMSTAAPALPPAAIVELVAWLSVAQMLHRLSVFYAVTV